MVARGQLSDNDIDRESAPLTTGDAARASLHLSIVHYAGSVEHYHHFLTGFFVPLLRYRRRTWDNPDYREILIRSCGPMDRLIRTLGSARLAILDKAEHQKLGAHRPALTGRLRGIAFGRRPMRFMEIRGHDHPTWYSRRAFAEASAAFRDLMAADLSACDAALAARFHRAAPRILLVRRGQPDPFYLSGRAEAPNAGIGRRSIPNHDAVLGGLSARFENVIDATLEDLTLTQQVSMFSSADVIIAQHGAALSNLIWAKSGCHVIEIVPKTLPREIAEIGFFSNLARCLRLPYQRIWQDSDHATVDVERVRAAVDRALSAAGAP